MKGVAVLVVLLALVAASAGEAKRQPVTLRVMTRNLYLGANLDTILQAKSFHEAFTAVEADWAQVQANDFRTRARAIAREISQTHPDFVGFQELSLYRTQTPADLTVTQATTLALDYAAELRKALAARKLRYRFLGIGNGTDAELPSGDPPQMDIRLTIRDGLLVRVDKKIKIGRVRTGLYATTTPLFAGLVTAKRGWVLADATVGGRTFRVITTHLESFNDTSQIAQGQELAQGPAATSLPTILLGDLNSRADGTGTPTHANLLDAGFKDAWPEAHPGDIGLTCCHGDDLRELGGPFYSRIDYVLLKNGFRALGAGIVGEAPGDRLGGLWPSDHAGVWARVRLN
ncbi:MAG: endonuclease/exonuclease/phosphatase family protein [Actinobacteria bacterium]|nr:endonuclease/exonuclease/phosphatase family protein [Actinomycetota bacterium]